MNPYFLPTDTIYTLCETHPQVIPVLLAHGFDKLANPQIRATIGKTMQLQTACQVRGVDLEALTQKMIAAIQGEEQGGAPLVTEGRQISTSGVATTIRGVLPCPIRIPFLDKMNTFIADQGLDVDYNLPAASGGLDWLEEESKDPDQLADLYLSVGFHVFFSDSFMKKYIQEELFAPDTLSYHPRFQQMADPLKKYSVLGVIPAVFLVNTQLLEGRPMPTSWANILDPVFENSVAIPQKDLDLFAAVLLHVYAEFGEEGVKKLAKNGQKSMHPAQMVKNAQGDPTPCISICPYFFGTMLPEEGPTVLQWPDEGAIVSPVFMLAKQEALQRTKPILDFLTTPDTIQVFSAGGKFPSVLGESPLSPDKKFLFCGWDYLHQKDFPVLLARLETLYEEWSTK